ncbi:MOSC domain-containing protein [Zhihengliuella sp.]|uniref:MOSC domain-containing protein n=1 Tax=Zhihengliuella sp. TaxID=1954483 RepID=UPI002811C55E|nr:MOSC domain-containing protein [Zhihengliuella sp.]
MSSDQRTASAHPATESAEPAPALAVGEVLAVCRVHQLVPDAGPVGITAIDKRPVEGPVKVGRLGLYADVQADRAHHGGEEQAVYAYAEEDAAEWAAELGCEIPPGLFGENLRVRGLAVSDAVIGERWRIGTALLEVTVPRTPCATFARRMGEPKWVRRFAERAATGAYLRVLRRGELAAGDAVAVVHRPDHGVSVRDLFLGPTPDEAGRLHAGREAGAWELTPKAAREVDRVLGAVES